MKDNEQLVKRQLTATVVLVSLVALAFMVIGAYYYFDGILREFFFR